MSELLAQQIALGVLVLFCLLVAYWFFRKYRELSQMWALGDELRAVESFSSTNSDEDVASMMVNLIRFARDEIEVFDDGNRMDGSVYENSVVVEALKRKLDETPHFRARFFFNADEELLLRKELAGRERVEIYAPAKGDQPDGRPQDQTHYKIIDKGRITYLSSHAYGAGERKFEVLDCRKVLPERFDEVANLRFGPLREEVWRNFPDFRPAAA